MELFKETPLSVGWRTWLARPPRPSLTIAVKASFELTPDVVRLAEEQPFPEGARWVDDEPERAQATPDELAPFKRRGECFVLGRCHPPGGEATRSQVAFAIGAVQKNVAVFGDRSVEGGLGSPAPFSSMPLSWERAFGGRGHAANPAGSPLPNLEDPQDLMQSRDDRPAPTCTTPLSPSWPLRARRAGTYDGGYMRTHYPGLAADIDWEYFNEAPTDQRIDGYWTGQETIALINLLPGTPSLRTRLPGIWPRAFLTPAGAPDPWAQLWEIPLRLDTLVVDGDARMVRCVWRGVLDVGTESLAEMGALCVLHEESPSAARSLDECRALFRAAEARRRAEEAALGGREPPAPAPEADADAPLFKTLMGAELKWAHLDQAMTMEAASSPRLMEELAAMMRAKGIEPAADRPLPSILEALPKDEGPPRALDEDELRQLEERMLEEERERMRGEGRQLRDAVRRALMQGDSCAGWDLSGADLSRLRLSGGDFRGAKLERAILAGTIFGDTAFDGATFTEAELSDAQFLGATFTGATFHFCRLERTHFRHATLDDARFSECLLKGARFSHSFGRAAELVDCRLTEATFDESRFEGADFTGSTLDRALLGRTSLVDAWLVEGVSAKEARFNRCDLTKLRASGGSDLSGAVFAGCTMVEARLSEAIARGADFSFSWLDRATFAGADLEEARLMACRMRKARFDGASLRGAMLHGSDLYEARLESADLSNADLRGASLHGAELFRAVLAGARLELASLTGTRVQP